MLPTILGGKSVEAGTMVASHTVALEIRSAEGEMIGTCSGVIIDPKVILTAGHCLTREGLRVRVKFGLGGKAGFLSEAESALYVSSKIPVKSKIPIKSKKRGEPSTDPLPKSPWENGELTFDPKLRSEILADIESRISLKTYSGAAFAPSVFFDLAVIKIEGLPPGFSPVEMASESPWFRMPVVVAGFGTDSRKASEAQLQLRQTTQFISGQAALRNGRPYAFEVYAPTLDGMCFGDSGGPTFVEADGGLKLLGINNGVTNNCASAGWITHPLYFRAFLEEAIRSLGERHLI
jgi:hypothetical protein